MHGDGGDDVDLQCEQLVSEPLPRQFGEGVRHDPLAIGFGPHHELPEKPLVAAERDRALEAQLVAAAMVAGEVDAVCRGNRRGAAGADGPVDEFESLFALSADG
ncbi:MAG: hypothetical protein C0485_09875 [Pirellula sp.]|nr:hypothetical protein [Pirellula sp.]